jgi:hypothetical protein
VNKTDEQSFEPLEFREFIALEKNAIPLYYRAYYTTKRNAFVCNISQELREQWEVFLTIDEAFFRGLVDCDHGGTIERGHSLILYMSAHGKMRIAMELAFAGCLAEARSILRDGVEFTAHAHKLRYRPDLLKVWLDKAEHKKEWEAEFWNKKSLFEGLPLLHDRWKHYSERGSHANLPNLIGKLGVRNDENSQTFRLSYHGGERGTQLFLEVQVLLNTCALMERTFFDDHRERLRFDEGLRVIRERISERVLAKNNELQALDPAEYERELREQAL